ncbi:MAG TPA: MFS transporter [bacterium]|nr:MFS transporter [bacterium]
MKKLYLFYIAFFPIMFCSGIIHSIFALYIEEFGVVKTEIGLVFTIGSLVGAIFSPFIGKLVDRKGKIPFILLSSFSFFIAFMGYSLAKNFSSIILSQIIEGAAWATFTISASALIADMVPAEKRGYAYAIYNQFWYFGWIIGPVSGGFLSEKFGFRITLLIGAGLNFISFIGIFLLHFLFSKKNRADS